MKINETSGLEYFEGDLITHNDSGGDPDIYRFNTRGELLESITIDDVRNNDWEDITMDEDYLYISNSGNNFGNKKNLSIVVADRKDRFKKLGIINFSYDGQEDFSQRVNHPYDAEALISVNDQLILFSKNRETLTTELFLIPKTVGDYQLRSIKSFNSEGLVTGADYSDSLKLAALVGYNRLGEQFLYTLPEFSLEKLGQVQLNKFLLPLFGKQIEAIKIIDSKTFWITSESVGTGYPMLYKVSLR